MALELKTGPSLVWLYASLFTYVAGFVAWLSCDITRMDTKSVAPRWQRYSAWVLYSAAAGLAMIAWVLRWVHLGHPPLRNMFDVFLTMGAAMLFVSLVSRHLLKVGYITWDLLLAVAILFPAGFVSKFEPDKEPLMPALQSPLFIPHVLVYMVGYVVMTKAAFPGFEALFRPGGSKRPDLVNPDKSIYRLICFGFPMINMGLLLGAWWGKYAWGDFWNWDPKEIWGLITWLIYAAYFHWRFMYGSRFGRINALFAILGLVAMLMTLIGVSYLPVFKGMHSYAS
jgi:ABC-type transport system involved in cytochrome c biogenesis permease subunit